MRRANLTVHGWVTVAVLLGTMTYAVAEDLILTTYYPSPRGVYNELRFSQATASGPGNLAVQGSLSVGPTFAPGGAGDAIIEGDVGIGTTTPQARLEIIPQAGDVGLAVNDPSGSAKALAAFAGTTVTSYFDSKGFLQVGFSQGRDAQNGIELNGGLCIGKSGFCATPAPDGGAIIQNAVGLGTNAPLSSISGIPITLTVAKGSAATPDAYLTAPVVPTPGSQPIGWVSGLTQIQYLRSSGGDGDKSLFCPAQYPVLLSCFAGDDYGRDNLSDTDPSNRTNLGADFIYLERVKPSNGRMGCLAYDKNHDHEGYFLEAVCANYPYFEFQ